MLARKTIVDQIEVDRGNNLGVRLCLLIVDGEQELKSSYHRTSIPPEGDAAVQMGFVNQHLATMGEEPVSQADIDRIVAFHALANQ